VDLATVTAIRPELESELVGRRFGKVFQLSRSDLAIDFRLTGSKYLFVSLQPGNPRTYLIKRRLRDLEKTAVNPSSFPLVLRKHLSGAEVSSITQVESERVLLIGLDGSDELDRPLSYILAIQLTGSSSNMFLLDSRAVIIDSMKETRGPGQQIGDRYEPPARSEGQDLRQPDSTAPPTGNISERLDAEDLARSTEDRFRSRATSARNKLKQEISKRRKLVRALNDDLAGHGNAEQWKRFGDLLLANVSNARRDGERVFVTDYFDPAAPEIAIDVDNNESITEAAEKFFRKYTKARNAGKEIQERLRQVEKELVTLDSKAAELEEVIATGDEDLLLEFVGEKGGTKKIERRKRVEAPSGIRTFISSDGYEILVGKKAKDNDHLTFRVAKSLDTWMHAADYPGSHVVVRNPNRKEIPHRTMVEAAQLAAFYSQGKKQPKAAVHYTQKKFVNKPKGAAPGLVSLASFKTLLVEPKIGEVTAKTD
jgi:predicted ribosome quality control (RQC) complex YloA/Tae2 family protein